MRWNQASRTADELALEVAFETSVTPECQELTTALKFTTFWQDQMIGPKATEEIQNCICVARVFFPLTTVSKILDAFLNP